MIGRYPGLGILVARKAARVVREAVRRRADLIAEKRARRAAREMEKANEGQTLRWLFGEHEAKGKARGKKSWPGSCKRSR